MKRDSWAFLLVLGLLGALPPLSIDIVTPTLLVLGTALRSTETEVAAIITFFMLGFAVGQFGSGLISDRYGRRPMLLGGLSLYTVAAIGCAFSATLGSMVAFRFLQGVGAGSCSVLTFAIVRDLFQGDSARVKRSYLTVIFGIAPMLAPLLGAAILHATGWQGVYLLVAALGAVLLLIVGTTFAESNLEARAAGLRAFGKSFGEVLTHRPFARTVATNCLSYAAVFTYIAGAPFVFIGDLGLSPTAFGVAFACGAAALAAGAAVSGHAARRAAECGTVVRYALAAAAAAAGLVTVLAFSVHGTAVPLTAGLSLCLFCRGIAAPNLQHHALEPMRMVAGTAAAVMGVAQILAGAIASAIVAFAVPVAGPPAMALLMLFFATFAALLWRP